MYNISLETLNLLPKLALAYPSDLFPYHGTLAFFLFLEGQTHSNYMTFVPAYLCAFQHNWFILVMCASASFSLLEKTIQSVATCSIFSVKISFISLKKWSHSEFIFFFNLNLISSLSLRTRFFSIQLTAVFPEPRNVGKVLNIFLNE